MGKVYLVGAGPGAPDLLTLRAARLIEAADIVFHDALIHPDTLALARGARKIDVGKRYGKVSTEQRFINRALVAAARTHDVVVRIRDTATDQILRAGVAPLWHKISVWRPAAVVFVYKRAAEIAAGRSLAEPWGQLVGVALSGRPCFLMPGPYAPSGEVAAGLNLIRNLGASLPR